MPRQIFHYEVERQCTLALMAYADVKQALTAWQQRPPAPPEINDTDVAPLQAAMARHDQWLSALDKHHWMHAVAAERVWFSVQAFLVAAGNISKLLWPAYRKGEDLLARRGPELRANLDVEEDSPLAPRTFRNHFEHFDLRLEQWTVSSQPRRFVDANIGPASMISGFDPGNCLRTFDTRNFAITFRGDRYHLLPLVEAIQQLWHNATIQLQQRASA